MAARVHKGTLKQPQNFTERVIQNVIHFVEELNARFSVYGNLPVYDKSLFPWTKELEDNWHLIRAELDKVLERKDELPAFHEITPEVRTITQDKNWKTFLFCGYGRWSERNAQLCPKTAYFLRRIPGIKTAFFSILEPGKYIPPHRGPYNGVLRLHLGLIVPEPRENCWIRVHDQKLHWEEGKVLIFDDCFEHEVHNNTQGLRAVLFVDFVRPTYFPANILNWLLLNIAYFTPYITEAEERERAWEQLFYGESKRFSQRS
ncbi:MAG: aspartyl/asparaginyl beta-hydroxylase domain-containing protein [Bacteroidia bacterium]|nr:aspartyl/asparaginyl beta-hydroxylase domain-containing protein [Bacteroidia bacterium]MDW8015985.1 aspartyl/asparaginyl beta-hydroxylase domain-containing protein [Bacteroidia bacterium]